MAQGSYLFTSESVSEGHPDKVCDRISEAVVDLFLTADPYARVACETLTTTNLIVLAGEVRGPASITHSHLEEIAREAVKQIGYEQKGFHWRDAVVESPEVRSPTVGRHSPHALYDKGCLTGIAPLPSIQVKNCRTMFRKAERT